MDGQEGSRLVLLGLFMSLLICTVSCSPIWQVSAEDSSQDIIYLDGRISGFLADDSNSHIREWEIRSGQWLSLSLDCDSCTAIVQLDGVNIETSTGLTEQAQTNGTVKMTITSTVNEHVYYSLLQAIDENYSTVRPSPNQNIKLYSSLECSNLTECINPKRGDLNSMPDGEYSSPFYLTGILEQSLPEYIPMNITAGDTLELETRYASGDVSFSVYFQNQSTETLHTEVLEHIHSTVNESSGETEFWHFNNSGRAIIKVESADLNTAWAIKSIRHASPSAMNFITNHSNIVLVGHYSSISTIVLNETQSLTFHAQHEDAEIHVRQLVAGNWIAGPNFNTSHGAPHFFYPYPNISAIQLEVFSKVHWIDVTVSDFSDIQSGKEAPSVRPSTKQTNNSSWPLISKQTSPLEGELTLSIHDTADVYKFEIQGWEESEHIIQFVLEGSELENLKLEVWNIDQETWEVLDTRTNALSNGELKSTLEIGRGTHFVRVAVLNSTNLTSNNWGEHVDAIEYLISSSYTLIDEGDEPYFPPDKNAEKWGVRARFFLGALFLVPVILFTISHYRNKKTAQELLMKTEQLSWLQQRLDSGDLTPKESRKDLSKALQAINLLNWDEANIAWGKPDLDYRTSNIALAVWRLDQRLAKTEGSIPVMVGVHIVEGMWDLAALRFDSPVGQPWTVSHVEPRFLYRGEEVFLDTMAHDNRTFVMVELEGDSSTVDIELNGRMNGQASAARIPTTLNVHNEEE